MNRQIYVNIPVKDLNRSIEFFTKLGFTFNPQFTDETATCMVIGPDNYVMLLTEAKFKEFTKKSVADATKSSEMIIAISAESREKVDEMVETALSSGGSLSMEPMDYEGFMYNRSFQDPDGHLWEVLYMNPNAVQNQ